MECPIKRKMRKLFEKSNDKPKKIKDTHILCLLPDNLNLL